MRTFTTSIAITALSLLAALGGCGGGGGGGMDSGDVTGTSTGSGGYAQTQLVTDVSLGAYDSGQRDAHLVNPWGLAFNPQGYVWVANNGTASSTLYDGMGVPQSLIVQTPPGPTGIVFNGSTSDFLLQGQPSPFIFATEGGLLAAWAPAAYASQAVTVYDGSAAAKSYKGLALGRQGALGRLYAADFHNGAVDVFDAGFRLVSLPAGAFRDPALPAGYAPFGIQLIGDRIYVAYAKQDAQAHDAQLGAGLGAVDVFDGTGTLIKQLVLGGALNAPWGLAMAPASGFGAFSGALLVANFGDGRIHAYDPASGQLLGALKKPDGMEIAIDGLWGIAFGNGINSQPQTTLFFGAGPNDEGHGVYGRIDPR